MSNDRKIIVETFISSPVELVWQRTQTPEQHLLWDIRFTFIQYLDQKDERGFHYMDYRTNIGFGITVSGVGRYLQNRPLHSSSFEFESNDWKSLITIGRGIWLYESYPEGTYFKTVYDYKVRYGIVGYWIDRLIFRPLMQLATEWGFETLRLWCQGNPEALMKRRKKKAFFWFFIKRLFGSKPKAEEARSWLGTGKEKKTIPPCTQKPHSNAEASPNIE